MRLNTFVMNCVALCSITASWALPVTDASADTGIVSGELHRREAAPIADEDAQSARQAAPWEIDAGNEEGDDGEAARPLVAHNATEPEDDDDAAKQMDDDWNPDGDSNDSLKPQPESTTSEDSTPLPLVRRAEATSNLPAASVPNPPSKPPLPPLPPLSQQPQQQQLPPGPLPQEQPQQPLRPLTPQQPQQPQLPQQTQQQDLTLPQQQPQQPQLLPQPLQPQQPQQQLPPGTPQPLPQQQPQQQFLPQESPQPLPQQQPQQLQQPLPQQLPQTLPQPDPLPAQLPPQSLPLQQLQQPQQQQNQQGLPTPQPQLTQQQPPQAIPDQAMDMWWYTLALTTGYEESSKGKEIKSITCTSKNGKYCYRVLKMQCEKNRDACYKTWLEECKGKKKVGCTVDK